MNSFENYIAQWREKKITTKKALEALQRKGYIEDFKERNFLVLKNIADKIDRLIKEGINLVKPELQQDDWREYVFTSCIPLCGSLGMTETEVVSGCVKLMKALSEGQICKEAEKAIFDEEFGWVLDLYSFAVATHAIYFHSRGKEYWEYWQEQNRPKLDIIDSDFI